MGEFVGFWEENACLNLVRARMERLISALRWRRKNSRLRRFLNFPQMFKNIMVRIARNTGVAVTRTCSRASAAENPLLHVEWLLTNRKALTSLCAFLTTIPNIRDAKTLDLTRMFSKQCFCDSNIPRSHGWLHLNHFPRSIISNRIQKLNASICSS